MSESIATGSRRQIYRKLCQLQEELNRSERARAILLGALSTLQRSTDLVERHRNLIADVIENYQAATAPPLPSTGELRVRR